MTPEQSRKARPDLWGAYDLAGQLSFAMASDGLVVAATSIGREAPVAHPDATGDVVELLDLLRTLLRERIEADAAAGKAVGR